MIVEGTKQLGSFKRGINLYIPKKVAQQNGGGGYSGPTIPVLSTFGIQVNGVTAENTSQVVSNVVNNAFFGNYLISNYSYQMDPAICDGSSTPPYSSPYIGNIFGPLAEGTEYTLSYSNGIWTLHFKMSNNYVPPIEHSTVNKTVTTNDANNIPLDFGEGITLTAITDPTYFQQFCG